MGENYIPTRNGDYNLWQANFRAKVVATPAAYGLTPADVVNLAIYSTAWETDLSASIVAKNTSIGANETRDDSRDVEESEIRQLVRRIQAWPGINGAKRGELNITEPDTTRTPLSEQVVLTEPSPVIKAKCTESKTVRIDWYPDQAPGQSEALPAGIAGVSIWYAEGGIPGDESQWRHLVLDSRSPYIHHVGNDATATMAYKAQWFDKRKRTGPFCDPVQVAVTA